MIKKIGALMLALVMVLSLGSVAFAADDTYTGSGNANATGVVGGTTIPLTKSIVFFNSNGSQIREPNISFTYTVTPVDAATANQGKPLSGVTVTDDGRLNSNTPVTVTVNDGVAAAFTSSLTLDFSDKKTEGGSTVANKQNAAVNGTEIEKTGNLVVNPTVFPHAGIYRFVINEAATPSDVTSVGLDTRDVAYDSTRYLDVYIKNGTSGLEMYGAVIFKSTAANAVDPTNGDITTTTEKTTGFEPHVDGTTVTEYENDPTVDKYHTFDLEVNKTTTGSLADKSNDFPFEITLTGNKAADIVVDYSNGAATWADGSSLTTGFATVPDTFVIDDNAKILTPKLSDGDSVTITGIPVGTKVQVKETNDTYDQYTPSITTQTGFTSLTLTETGALTAQTGTTQLSAATEITSKTAKSVIGLTNTLSEVSPTGVVLRIAPYLLMLGAGVTLFVILMVKRRKTSEEEA